MNKDIIRISDEFGNIQEGKLFETDYICPSCADKLFIISDIQIGINASIPNYMDKIKNLYCKKCDELFCVDDILRIEKNFDDSLQCTDNNLKTNKEVLSSLVKENDNDSNSWKKEFELEQSYDGNQERVNGLLRHKHVGSFEKVYTYISASDEWIVPNFPVITFGIKNVPSVLEDGSPKRFMVFHASDDKPSLIYLYNNNCGYYASAEKGRGYYCFYDKKNNKPIVDFPDSTDDEKYYLNVLSFLIANYSGKNANLFYTLDPNYKNPIDLKTEWDSGFFDESKFGYKKEYLEILDMSKKFEKYSYIYSGDLFDIFNDDDISQVNKLFPDYKKKINGLPLAVITIAYNAKKIYEFYVEKGIDANVQDMVFGMNVFHHAITFNSEQDRLFFLDKLYNEDVDVNNQDTYGMSCMFTAIVNKDNNIFDMLYENKKINFNTIYIEKVTDDFLVKENLLYTAVAYKNIYALEKLLLKIDVNNWLASSLDLLTYALIIINDSCNDEDLKIIKILLDNNVIIPNRINFLGAHSYDGYGGIYSKSKTNQKIIEMIENEKHRRNEE